MPPRKVKKTNREAILNEIEPLNKIFQLGALDSMYAFSQILKESEDKMKSIIKTDLYSKSIAEIVDVFGTKPEKVATPSNSCETVSPKDELMLTPTNKKDILDDSPLTRTIKKLNELSVSKSQKKPTALRMVPSSTVGTPRRLNVFETKEPPAEIRNKKREDAANGIADKLKHAAELRQLYNESKKEKIRQAREERERAVREKREQKEREEREKRELQRQREKKLEELNRPVVKSRFNSPSRHVLPKVDSHHATPGRPPAKLAKRLFNGSVQNSPNKTKASTPRIRKKSSKALKKSAQLEDTNTLMKQQEEYLLGMTEQNDAIEDEIEIDNAMIVEDGDVADVEESFEMDEAGERERLRLEEEEEEEERRKQEEQRRKEEERRVEEERKLEEERRWHEEQLELQRMREREMEEVRLAAAKEEMLLREKLNEQRDVTSPPESTSKSNQDYGLDLSSGDETDNEDAPRNEIPEWADWAQIRRDCRKNAQNKPFEVEKFFGEIPEMNTQLMFGNNVKVRKRGSSAVWKTPPVRRN